MRRNWDVLRDINTILDLYEGSLTELESQRASLEQSIQSARVRQGRMSNIGLVGLQQKVAKFRRQTAELLDSAEDITLLIQELQGD